MFQFYDSTIKRCLCNEDGKVMIVMFQFYDSTIKRFLTITCSEQVEEGFNSTIVRLKEEADGETTKYLIGFNSTIVRLKAFLNALHH